MRKLIVTVVTLVLFFSSYNSANAIVVIPALILIPIAKLVAVIIAGISIPAVGISAVTAKIKNKPVLKAVLLAVGVLLVIAVILIVVLRIIYPESSFL